MGYFCRHGIVNYHRKKIYIYLPNLGISEYCRITNYFNFASSLMEDGPLLKLTT